MENAGIASDDTRGTRPRAVAYVVGAAPEPCASCGSRHISVCAAIEDRDLGRLAELAQTETIAAGQTFIQEDDPAAAFFNVTSGTVRLFKLLADGRRQITGFSGPGHFLGLAVSPRYACSAEAVDAVRLCRFSRARLQRLLADFPALEARLMAVAVSELAAAQDQMLLLGRKTARERVASFLVGFAASVRPCAAQTRRLHLPMPRGDIADYLGLTIETVSRTIGWLKTERVIALHGASEVEILNPTALRALAEATA